MVLVTVAAPAAEKREFAFSLWETIAEPFVYFATKPEGEQAIEFTRVEGRIAIGMQGMLSWYRTASRTAGVLGSVFNPR